MTPDTTIYMIAGFVVILLGIIGYFVSLLVCNRILDQKNK
jgi:uncharacterized membrane protein YbaN (DUF454 family)